MELKIISKYHIFLENDDFLNCKFIHSYKNTYSNNTSLIFQLSLLIMKQFQRNFKKYSHTYMCNYN